MVAVGSSLWLPEESMIDAACALSGSGPAYIFLMAESLARSGERSGLPRPIAQQLARMTIVGAGAVLGASDEDPAELRRQVTSPGGTTEAGLAALMRSDALDDLLAETIEAATQRSREIGLAT